MKNESPKTPYSCLTLPPAPASGFSHLCLAFGGYLTLHCGPNLRTVTYSCAGWALCKGATYVGVFIVIIFLKGAAECVILTKSIYHDQLLGQTKHLDGVYLHSSQGDFV